MAALHDDELAIDTGLVRALVETSMPHLAGPSVTPLAASGSSNALFRLGDGLLVRLPRQPGGGASIAKEARWTPHVAAGLPVPVPTVVAVGEPACGYPERWSVVEWLDGEVPVAGGASTPELAADLAAVVAAFGALPVPPAALADPDLRWYRAQPLARIDAEVRQWLTDCRRSTDPGLDLDACARLWDDVLALPPPAARAPRWLHADLVAENLLVRDGRLAAVLDLGALCVGDPTVDLLVAWELLDPPDRARFRAALGVDDATWARGRAWTVALALSTFSYYGRTLPERCADRLSAARAALAEGPV